MYFSDSSHTWHVAKTGNDGNGGHAQQYPVNLANDAKLTIGAAITAASAGDTIIIWPGTYNENVNVSKRLNVIGFGPKTSVISVSSSHALKISAAGSRVEGIGAITTAAGITYGIYNNGGNNNVLIEDCYGEGDYDGIHLGGGSNIRLINSHGKGKFDGIQLDDGENILVDGCIAETDGSNTASEVHAIKTNACKRVIIRNTVAYAARSLNGDNYHLFGVNILGQVLLENVVVDVNHSGSGNHNTRGIYVDSSGNAVCRNINVRVDRSAGAWYGAEITGKAMIVDAYFELGPPIGTCYRIKSSGTCWVANIGCDFVGTPDNGTIQYMYPLADSAGGVDVTKINGSGDSADRLEKATKLLINKAIQNKTTGKIDYYEDDGETVALTHIPTDEESQITRTPS
jgi:hypothetical protein